MKGVSIMFELCSGEHRNSLSSKLVVHGNIKFASEIRSIAIHLSRAGKSLYQAQDDIKAFVIRKCGGEWYKKWGNAVQTIVEDVYNDAVRESSSIQTDCEGCIIWF